VANRKPKPLPKPEVISAATARKYWRALMANVVSLIEDAVLLLEQSPARARSLLILAQEEIGKAHRLYELSIDAWNSGSSTVELPGSFKEMERLHHPKIIQSLDFGADLPMFWGDYSGLDAYAGMTTEEMIEKMIEEAPTVNESREVDAKAINLQKQAGFYVDRHGDDVSTPQDTQVDDLMDLVIQTAGVAEMLLITDHSRMKFETPDQYEGTQDLQFRLLPFSHPEDFFTGEEPELP
jgi:AbiV family abortive infection protein